MSTYIGKVQIGSELVPIASSIFGYCSTAADVAAKAVTLEDFDRALPGVTIFVRFNNGNAVATNMTMAVGGLTAYNVTGNAVCGANTVLAFTLDAVVSSGSITSATWRCLGNAAFPALNNPEDIGSSANKGSSAYYAREDHVHKITVGQGDSNGQVKVAGQNASVKGLKSAAYEETTAFATSAQGTLADNAMPKSGGTFTGNVILNGTSNDSNSATTKQYVDNAIATALTGTADAMIFKGTLGAAAQNPTRTSVPTNGYSIGDTYRIVTAGTYAGNTCEVGDLLIAINNGPASGSSVINADWTVAQGNIDGAVTGPASATDAHVVTFDGNTGKIVKDSGKTIGKSVPSDAVFRDTTYSLTTGANAFTGCAAAASSDTGATVLVSVSQGVLTLQEGIKFTTTAVGTALSPTVNGHNDT